MSIATEVREPASTPEAGGDPVRQALVDVAAGRTVLVVGQQHGALVLPAFAATAASVGYLIRHTSGLLVAPMSGPDLERLRVPPMVAHARDPQRPDYAVPVDAVLASGPGSSPADRATTLRALADPRTAAGQLRRPGHVQPVRTAAGGVLERAGHAEAALDLTSLAGVAPVSAVAELVGTDGGLLPAPAAARFAAEHGLAAVSIAELSTHRLRYERQVERVTEARLPTAHGEFSALGYRYPYEGSEHLALVHGDIADGARTPVRLHRECPVGDPFRSLRCDCRRRLDEAMADIVARGGGVLVYVREAPRGAAPADPSRDQAIFAHILADLGVPSERAWSEEPAAVPHG